MTVKLVVAVRPAPSATETTFEPPGAVAVPSKVYTPFPVQPLPSDG